MTESLSDVSPVGSSEWKGWTRFGLKAPFWVVFGIWVSAILIPVMGNLAGSTGVVLFAIAACAACGAGWYLLKREQQSGLVRPWHWMLAGGGSYGVALSLLGFLLRATDSDFLEIVFGILALGGVMGCFVASIVMFIAAATRPSNAVPGPVGVPQQQMVAPIIGYSANGTPVYGQPGYIQPQNVGTNICAILALIFGFLGGLLAIVFGHIALAQIKRTGEQGRGMAIAGLALGYSFLVVGILLLLAFISVSG